MPSGPLAEECRVALWQRYVEWPVGRSISSGPLAEVCRVARRQRYVEWPGGRGMPSDPVKEVCRLAWCGRGMPSDPVKEEAFEDPTWFCAGCTGTKEQLDINFVPEPLVSSYEPTVDKGFRIHTELTQVVSRKEQNTSILRSLALETMDAMYSEPD
ncbi:hypothetical protein TNCT_316881 [Trichonephila clavata]|uniref:Uncharacterized protein n=1 Tax=Trichonephila clavata TaxID=2740835 RepID=A0A8X6GCC9_TRICU|nr:hypothetical protein TNCT_316881 [Trichonephila clavata]